MKSITVLEFKREEARKPELDSFVVMYEMDGIYKESKICIENSGIRVVKRGELEIAIGTSPASLISRKLLEYIDGGEIVFPFELQVD